MPFPSPHEPPKSTLALARPTTVVSDLHLVPGTPRAVTTDLARLVESRPGARIVFGGDTFDHSADPSAKPHPLDDAATTSSRRLASVFDAHPQLHAALSSHVRGGGELWFVAGNHDAEVGTPAFAAALTSALGGAPSRVRTTPWFFRSGGVHFEHGHLYDPDNAPVHPLVVGEDSLGVHFVKSFIRETGAHAYLHVNDGTPLRLFLNSFRWYGLRAPAVIYRFFHTAATALARSGPFFRGHDEEARGREAAIALAPLLGASASELDALYGLRATPTMVDFERTFARLYLDRVAAAISLTGGAVALAASGGRAKSAAGAMVLFGAMTLGASWSRGHDRYRGTVSDRLARAATRVAETSEAELVVFGHTHVPIQRDRYANPGSFSFPKAGTPRSFLEIEAREEGPVARLSGWHAGR